MNLIREYKPPRVPDTKVKMYAELKRKTKKCLQCNKRKSTDFFRLRKNKPGRNPHLESYCKACEAENNRRRYENVKHIYKIRDFGRNCEKFGITVEEYKKMFDLQNGKCGICNQHETQRRNGVLKNLAIDHCHVTGKNRMLLCNACNTAIGLLKENIEIIEAAVLYLKKFKN